MKKTGLYLVLFLSLTAAAQESVEPRLILRSTLSMSAPRTHDPNNYILQQCVGQSSVIGDYESEGYLLSQGFVQANAQSKIAHSDDLPHLNVRIFPNPFVDEVNISFLEPLKETVDLFVFNDMGHKLKSVTCDVSNELSVRLGHLPPGKYYIKIVTGHQQFVTHLVKLE